MGDALRALHADNPLFDGEAGEIDDGWLSVRSAPAAIRRFVAIAPSPHTGVIDLDKLALLQSRPILGRGPQRQMARFILDRAVLYSGKPRSRNDPPEYAAEWPA